MQENITLSKKEQKINDTMIMLTSKKITVLEASILLDLSERQIYRKKKAYIEEGIISIPHKLKNKSSKRLYSSELKENIINIYKNEFNGWNFYHFNDHLAFFYNINVSNSFIYKLLTKNGYKSPNSHKKFKFESHPPRERKQNAGELVQIDACTFKWFENNENEYTLHASIDDATNTVTGAYFSKEESIYGYQKLLEIIIKKYGIPKCLYSDYRTIFSSKEKRTPKFITTLSNLGINIIPTHNPMAKGRIERLWKTFQDRLYNEMKKSNVKNIDQANMFLNSFIPRYNEKFSYPININKSMFIAVPTNFNYNLELSTYEEVTIYNNSYVFFNNTYNVILDNNKKVFIDTNKKVKLITCLDQKNYILYNNKLYKTKEIIPYSLMKKSAYANISEVKTNIY